MAFRVTRIWWTDMRHNFYIELLRKPSGLFKPQPYLYSCIRCKWAFLVNVRRGSLTAVDVDGVPLSQPENSKRVGTFAEGPCPAFPASLSANSLGKNGASNSNGSAPRPDLKVVPLRTAPAGQSPPESK